MDEGMDSADWQAVPKEECKILLWMLCLAGFANSGSQSSLYEVLPQANLPMGNATLQFVGKNETIWTSGTICSNYYSYLYTYDLNG